MLNSWSRRFAYAYALIFAIPKLAGFHYFLLKLAMHGLGILNYYDPALTGERYLVSYLLPRLISNRNSPVFVDVGANQGLYSLQLAGKFPFATIYAFEPHPKNFEVLLQLRLKNYYPYQQALGDATGVTNLYDHHDRDGSTNASLFQEVISEIHHSTPVAHRVEMGTLDSFVASSDIAHIDFLKVDTEGNELAVLRGAQSLLTEKRIDVIQFEFNEMNVISHSFLHDFRNCLQGYQLFRLLPRGLLLVPESPVVSEWFAFQNIIAVSPSAARGL